MLAGFGDVLCLFGCDRCGDDLVDQVVWFEGLVLVVKGIIV